MAVAQFTREPVLRRDDLAQLVGMNPRLMSAFEDQAAAVQDSTSKVAETAALKDATVIVLSANGDFTNERVLVVGDGIDIDVTDTTVSLRVKDVARTSNYTVMLIPPGDASLFLPVDGTLVSQEHAETLLQKTLDAPKLTGLGNYANDAAAATGGVPVTGVYRNGSVLMVRVV
jgi:hypothetical protein